MDITFVRIAWTVATFFTFLAIVIWAYSGRAGKGFEQAARLPFDDELDRTGSGGDSGSGR
jgi:cytochrome c oxidase cbb3-type subunit 4